MHEERVMGSREDRVIAGENRTNSSEFNQALKKWMFMNGAAIRTSGERNASP
jgi:hypothetical protein